jgi:hypothetical protein
MFFSVVPSGGRENLENLIDSQTIVRFESPEKNFFVEKSLIAAGANREPQGTHQQISAEDAMKLEFDKGRIYYPRQWYLGWRHLLRQWGQFCDRDNETANQRVSIVNHPEEIIQMFDKRICYQLFTANSQVHQDFSHGSEIDSDATLSKIRKLGQRNQPSKIPLPRCLGAIRSYDELREQMQVQNLSRVFVKLAHGSAASGVVAYRISPKGESAITTVERVRQNGETILYNSRKIRNYLNREEISDSINILCREGVQVEAWLPKARLQNRPFDLRVVVIAGEAQHIVVRLGKSPMTNLHLKSDRGNSQEFLQRVGAENWQTMKETCEAAAALFPKSLYCGIDLLVYPDFRRHAILEINAFGDLLPGITWNNMDTYTSELKAILQRFSFK